MSRRPTILALLAAAIATASGPAWADDLAVGHHLWSVRAGSGVTSYLATYASGDRRTLPLLDQQLAAASTVRRLIFSSDGKTPIEPKTGPWNATIATGLPPELAAAVKDAIGPMIATMGLPADKLDTMPLAGARFLMMMSPDTVHRGEADEGRKQVLAFIEARAGESKRDGHTLALRALTPEQTAALFGPALGEPMPPDQAFRRLLDDRRQNGPLVDRLTRSYMTGAWGPHPDLSSLLMLALTGRETQPPELFASGEELARLAEPLLAQEPTLILVSETSLLPGESGLLRELERKGFQVEPVALQAEAR